MMKKFIALLLLCALLLCGCQVEIVLDPTEPETTVPSDQLLTVHFIDVGQADCALLECGGEYMLIDGGNVDDGQLVVSYLESCSVEELSVVVSTHAHEDHVGGLPSVLAVFPTGRVFSPTTTYASRCFDDFMYYSDQQGITVEIPTPGDTFTLGGATVEVLGPVKTYPDPNDTSIVLKVTFGNNSFLFTGDMETGAENDMLDAGADVSCDVLKMGHHGSSTSSSYRFLYEADPDYAIISCGKDNSYGHPHDEVVSRLKDAGIPSFRTDELGSILAVSDGNTITITWDNSAATPENVEEADPTLIGNVNSKKLHSPSCNALPSEKNRVLFDDYQQAIDAGYTPCGNCLG